MEREEQRQSQGEITLHALRSGTLRESRMREIRPSGLGSGKGKRGLVQHWHATAPLLDFTTLTLLTTLLLVPLTGLHAAELVTDKVDWPAFLARHDLVFERLPTQFDFGAFLGNGVLGAMIYRDGDNRLRFEMGRADVTEHRRDNSRLPIGGLVLETAGKIQNGRMRLDLWNAEVRGTVTTDKGEIRFRSLIHTREMLMVIDVETGGSESGAKFSWNATPCVEYVCAAAFTTDPPNPPATTETKDGITVCRQDRFAGGQFATAWTEVKQASMRRVLLSIGDTFPARTAGEEAVRAVKQAAAAEFDPLLKAHRDWWHAFYPESFVSIPDARMESFYWIQWYKFACISRPGALPVDLLGVWFRKTGWPRIWWDLNIQILYQPVYTGNRLMLGESLRDFFDARRESFYRNAKDRWGYDDCAYATVTTDNHGLRGDGVRAPDLPGKGYWTSPGHLTWALQNYYLHYRYTMDHALVTDHKAHAFYPLLRDSVRLYLRLLKQGGDGQLHLAAKDSCSPEYSPCGDDSNYGLALLRWGCQTLLALNRRYALQDPLAAQWQETLDHLAPYPVDDSGFMISAKVPLAKSHRHWSHLFMVSPLHLLDLESPANRTLAEKSIAHWLTVDGGRQVYGWSHAATASMYAALGDGNRAMEHIHAHLADKRFIRPNTMYIEGAPVVECAITLNSSLHDMLLQSWGNTIDIFPAVPAAWTNAVFHNLRAEGAFLVSAERKAGTTQWVRVKSLAGEPCRIRFNGKIQALHLAPGEEKLLGDGPSVVTPLPIAPADANPHGLRVPNGPP